MHSEVATSSISLHRFRITPEWCARALLVLVLFKFSGFRLWPHIYLGQPYEPARLIYYSEFLATVLVFAFALCRPKQIVAACLKNPLPTLFMIYAVGSAFLVGQFILGKFLTALGYWELFITLALAFHIVGQSVTRQTLAYWAFFGILLNLAAVVVPSTSFMTGYFSGYYRGLTAHRNDLAQIATACVFFSLTAAGLTPAWMRILTLTGAVLLVGLAGSVQGILLLAAGSIIYVFAGKAHLLRHPMVIGHALFISAMLTMAWVSIGGLDGFLQLFNRDSSFTGRDRIWDLSSYLLARMPLGGYGADAVGSGTVSAALLQSFGLGTVFGTAHNSYLEALLAYGWIGGGLFLFAVIDGARKVMSATVKTPCAASIFALILLVSCIFGGITASEKLFLPQFGWLTFILAIFIADSVRSSDLETV